MSSSKWLNQLLTKYNIPESEFSKIGLTSEELSDIKKDYDIFKKQLDLPAKYLIQEFLQAKKVHSVRYRIKNSDHLIVKIIRKKIGDSSREINLDNYKSEITDLIGIRVLHLFKEDWFDIHQFITTNWDRKENPIAFYREGDTDDVISHFTEHGCNIQKHNSGYRSVHYLIETKPKKTTFVAEIQVRTIFEEGWSEIDHRLRYPSYLDNNLLNGYLDLFNRMAGGLDIMGSYVKNLKEELIAIEQKNKVKVEALQKEIDKLQIEKSQKSKLQDDLGDIGRIRIDTNINDRPILFSSGLTVSQMISTNPLNLDVTKGNSILSSIDFKRSDD